MMRQFELVEIVKAYDPGADENLINKAYVYAMKAHGSQMRASGDPYFSHPLEVAGILTSYRLDAATIATALLHDVVEDTGATKDELETMFGVEVAKLVDGVTKLTQIELQSDHSKQAENFRKLLLAMSEDIRVLLVKLADRLHNMRTLHFIKKPEKRKRIATETMEIFSPLAERIGMQELKNELDDLAFSEINAEARDSILKRLQYLRDEGETLVPLIINELRQTLKDNGVMADVTGREKTAYSIWRKMQKKDVPFEAMSDIMAFRIAVDTTADCYKALGVIHNAYRVVPDRFKDYISVPKPNGYQSLHTGVIGPERHRIEIQIRTHDMHEVAESGVAAHWQYKQDDEQDVSGKPTDGKQYRWLRELLEILDTAAEPDEFLEHTKLEMFQDQVFCFTPKGDLINLPQDATPVDFAYAVHTEVGDRCVGAKINGRMMPLRTRLKNGDQVDIVTSKTHTPSPTWDNFVVTGKARARIRRYVRLKERDQYVELGHAMLERAFVEEDYPLTEKGLKGVLKIFKKDTVDELTAQVGMGHTTAREVLEAVYPGTKKQSVARRISDMMPLPRSKRRDKKKTKRDAAIPIRGLIPGMAMHYARCCHPLPGDRIVGIITTGKGVTIHTIDCEGLRQYDDEPERWIDVSWETGEDAMEPSGYVSRVHLTLLNVPGALGSLSNVVARGEGNISNLKIQNRASDFYDMMVDIEVRDVKHLNEIIAALRATPEINSIERTRG